MNSDRKPFFRFQSNDSKFYQNENVNQMGNTISYSPPLKHGVDSNFQSETLDNNLLSTKRRKLPFFAPKFQLGTKTISSQLQSSNITDSIKQSVAESYDTDSFSSAIVMPARDTGLSFSELALDLQGNNIRKLPSSFTAGPTRELSSSLEFRYDYPNESLSTSNFRNGNIVFSPVYSRFSKNTRILPRGDKDISGLLYGKHMADCTYPYSVRLLAQDES